MEVTDREEREGPELQGTEDFWITRPYSQLRRENRNTFLLGMVIGFCIPFVLGLLGFIYYIK